MQVYDVFYQVATRLPPTQVGRLAKTHKQAHEYGIRGLEQYLRYFFPMTPSSTVEELKILHMKILRIESIAASNPNCDYNSIKDSLRQNNYDFSPMILNLNPLKLVERDLKIVIFQGRRPNFTTPVIACYIILHYYNGDIVNTIMQLTMADELVFTEDKIFGIVFKDLGIRKTQNFIKYGVGDIFNQVWK